MNFQAILSHPFGFYVFLIADSQTEIDPLKVCFYLGIVLLLSCVIVLVTPLRDKISSATQKIAGFGLNLEVSVLTLLFLISAALISSGVWVKFGSVKDQLAEARLDKEKAEANLVSLREEMDRFKRNSAEAWITLEGVDDVAKLNFPDLHCDYQTSAADAGEKCIITKGDLIHGVRVIFTDINKGTKIKKLVITEGDPPKRTWSYPNEFDPFKQNLKMLKGGPA
jgi:hypothetical protein